MSPVALTVPIEGVQIIEASAGTGKTWTLSGLYLRFILEAGLPVEGVLAVTFTRAAAAELRERIRGRIAALLDLLEGHGTGDRLCALLKTRLIDTGQVDEELARRRLRAALYAFDDAALYTIHGFCQRVLGDRAFASALPFDTEVLPDPREPLYQVVADFWRRRIASPAEDGGPFHEAFVAWLLSRGIGPEALSRWISPLLARAGFRVDPPPEPATGLIERHGALRERLSELWSAERGAVLGLLGTLRQNAYRQDRVENWAGEIDRYLGPEADPLSIPEALERFTPRRIAKASRGTPPDHPLFTRVEELLATHVALTGAFEARLAGLRIALLEEARAGLEATLRRAHLQTYDALLENLHEALSGPGGEALARGLGRRYPAALIDEFQDTDPLQYAIFRRIYGDGGGTLILVGDPKQAIYGFRGADLHTYLVARETNRTVHTLDQNQRSVPGLVSALNTLFGAGPRPFRSERIRFQPVGAPDDPRPALREEGIVDPAPLRVFLCPSQDKPVSKSEARDWAAGTVAAEIARLLAAAESGALSLGEEPLAARDIAVLVTEHAQGSQVRRYLQALGIACAERSKDSVFHSPEAETLERVMLALAEPRRLGWVRAALASELFDLSARDLAALETEPALLEDRLAELERYQHLWRGRGFMHMFRRLVAEAGVVARLGPYSDGDRRLTNLFHLAELIESAGRHGLEAQITWLAARRRDVGTGAAAELRVEGDEGLVQIVTIHQSKGLEYPVTFVPFLWDGKTRADKGETFLYHDDADRPVLDLGSERRDEALARALEEERAERLRLAYVALTRARNRCYLLFGRIKEAETSPLAWLLFGADASFTDPELRSRWLYLSGLSEGQIRIQDVPEPPPPRPPVMTPGRTLAARVLKRPVPAARRVVSFTSLHAGGEWRAELPDHDEAEALSVPGEPGGGRFEFPRGAAAGDCLHAILERIDFSAAPEDWRGVIETRLAEVGYPPGWAPALSDWIAECLATPLSTGGTGGPSLAHVSPRECLKELEFQLPVENLDPGRIAVLAERDGLSLPSLSGERLSGYLKGFIDLVYVHEDRYYLADYKSSWLGAGPEHYDRPGLEVAMAGSSYHLQYLLYTVALHRWLGRRRAGYDYERHFGGVHYLFLRGMSPGWADPQGRPPGVYWTRPRGPLIAALDRLLRAP